LNFWPLSTYLGELLAELRAWDGKELCLLDFDIGLGNISGPGRPGNELENISLAYMDSNTGA
jgi:hypothetical protein